MAACGKCGWRRCHAVFRAETTAEGNAETKFVCLPGCLATSWKKSTKANGSHLRPGPVVRLRAFLCFPVPQLVARQPGRHTNLVSAFPSAVVSAQKTTWHLRKMSLDSTQRDAPAIS